jgi:hypothetical protein
MAMAVQRCFKDAQVTIGPWIDRGFYYDFDLKTPLTDKDLKKIRKEMQKIIKMNLPFRREEVGGSEGVGGRDRGDCCPWSSSSSADVPTCWRQQGALCGGYNIPGNRPVSHTPHTVAVTAGVCGAAAVWWVELLTSHTACSSRRWTAGCVAGIHPSS